MAGDAWNLEAVWPCGSKNGIQLGLRTEVVKRGDVELLRNGLVARWCDLVEGGTAEEVVAAEGGAGGGAGVAAEVAKVGNAFDTDEGWRREVGGCIGGDVQSGWRRGAGV